ncbi:MAG TPA: NAD-dependent epimerase/dehydratase family protein [Anaerolineales bacterium]|nr:NAD-dependent epimerase/dehydratase family protein [Anaerolineales bacterium]
MILITGATGHIGNVLARRLARLGRSLRALVLPGEGLEALQGVPLEIVRGDVTREDDVARAVEGVDTVFHLAGLISTLPDPQPEVERVNVEGTATVVAACRRGGVRRLVYTSSIHALRRRPPGVILDETASFDARSAIAAYDRSKANASLLVQQASREGLDAVIVCPTGVIGPMDFRMSEMGGLVHDALIQRVLWTTDGAYNFVDVRDVAEGEILAASRGRTGETYILGGERVTVRRLMDLVRHAAGRTGRILRVPLPLVRLAARFAPLWASMQRSRPRLTPYAVETLQSHSHISSARARRHLGYQTRPLYETLIDTISWWRGSPTLCSSTSST